MNKPLHERDANRDPITGEPGSHPVGTTVGAAAAGTAGAVVGSVAGPLGIVVGSALGVAAGAALGHNAAEAANPTYVAVEPDLVDTFAQRPYAAGRTYEDYRDAYAFGAAERERLGGRDPVVWDDTLEADLRTRWNHSSSKARMAWEDAKQAVRDSWHAVERRLPGDFDGDGR